MNLIYESRKILENHDQLQILFVSTMFVFMTTKAP